MVIGCKDGTLLLIDYAASQICHKVKAHDAAIWSLDVRRSYNDEEGEEVVVVVTGSADKTVKVWELEEEGGEERRERLGASVCTVVCALPRCC